MNPVWTITYNGVEQSAAAWGLTAQPIIKTRDRSPTVFSFRMAGAAPEGAIPFPFKSQVTIRQNRTFSGGGWGGNGYVFVGYQTTQNGLVDGRGQGIMLEFADTLWLLQNTVFQQAWKSNAGIINFSRVVLFMDINNWVPNLYQSVQWQIQQIIAWAAGCTYDGVHNIPIQAGTIDYSGWFLNYYHCRAVSCWEALLKCLEPIPDAKVWIDSSTNPPSLHVRTRANIAAMAAPAGTGPGPITLPYKGSDAAGRVHFSSQIKPRYDLVAPQVVLQYQTQSQLDGEAIASFSSDVYPANSSGQQTFALVAPIDLTGVTVVSETGQLDCEPLACIGGTQATKRAWWAAKRGGEQDKLNDLRVRFQDTNRLQGSPVTPTTIPDAIIVDDYGNPIDLDAYPNRMVRGAYHPWMGVNVIRAHIIAYGAQFSEYDVPGVSEVDITGNVTRKNASHDLHCHVTLTNCVAGLTTFSGLKQTGGYSETAIEGLAQNIFNSRATLDYEGSHEIIDPGIPGSKAPLAQIIGHWNVLNISGGNAAWANAAITVAATEIDLLTNHQRIEIGPSKHLQPQDWSAMLQFFRYRRMYMPSSVRATGRQDPNNNIEMALNTADGNTVPGLTVESATTLISYEVPGDPTSPATAIISLDAADVIATAQKN